MKHRKGYHDEAARAARYAANRARTSDGAPMATDDVGVIYALGPPGPALTKIGHTTQLKVRYHQIQKCSPVELALHAHWCGAVGDEARLHEVFADRRKHGEWFDLAGVDVVLAISKLLGRPPRQRIDLTIYRPWDLVKMSEVQQGGLW